MTTGCGSGGTTGFPAADSSDHPVPSAGPTGHPMSRVHAVGARGHCRCLVGERHRHGHAGACPASPAADARPQPAEEASLAESPDMTNHMCNYRTPRFHIAHHASVMSL